jgi:hypothetical protein
MVGEHSQNSGSYSAITSPCDPYFENAPTLNKHLCYCQLKGSENWEHVHMKLHLCEEGSPISWTFFMLQNHLSNHTPASVEHWLLCTKEWTENRWKDMSRHIVKNLFHPNLPHTSDLKKKGIILSVKYQGKCPQAQVLTHSKWTSWVNWREPTRSTTCPLVELANHRQQASSHQTLSPNLRSKSICLGWS